MLAVSEAFQEAIRADKRRILGRVTIDYTDPYMDGSITVTSDDVARISWPAQTADAVEAPTHAWASLDGSWVLDGSYHLAPDTPGEAQQYQMGWWSESLAGEDGGFGEPYPTLTVLFDERPIRSLKVVGDSARTEYPVDFDIYLYDKAGNLLYTETVRDNARITWTKELSEPVSSVVRMVLGISRWSHPGRQAKIVEFYSSIQETYEGERILELSLLDEREVDTGSVPVGNISANELSITLDNADHRFDPGNTESPLYGLIKAHRRLRAWLGAVLSDGSVEWLPLGVFWAVEWDVPNSQSETVARVIARDRLELLRQSTYQSTRVAQNVSLYDLAVAVLQDAGLTPNEYVVDPALQDTIVPYAWFDSVSHREALRQIAEAALGQVYCDREGRVRITVEQRYEPRAVWSFVDGRLLPVQTEMLEAYGISPDDYFSLSFPSRQNQVANEVIVDTQPLRPAAGTQEIYRSNEPIQLLTGQTITITVHYNQVPSMDVAAALENAPDGVIISGATYYGWGADITIQNIGADAEAALVVTGQPLSVQNRERAVAMDETSIRTNGRLRYQYPANHLVQSLTVAQAIADGLVASYKDPRRDVSLEWRGNPALELGDVITVPESPDGTRRGYFAIYRQELTWAGGLTARTEGRRIW